jgi:hypothetical protein
MSNLRVFGPSLHAIGRQHCGEVQKTPVNNGVLSLLNSSKPVQNEIKCHCQTQTNKGLPRSGRKEGIIVKIEGKSAGKHHQTSPDLLLPAVITFRCICVSR